MRFRGLLIAVLCCLPVTLMAQQRSEDPAYIPPGIEWALDQVHQDSVTWNHGPSRRRNGPYNEMWQIVNFKRGREQCFQGIGCVASWKNLLQFNCRERTYRIISASSHNATGGAGRVLNVDDQPQPWRRIAPDTIIDSSLRRACN